MKLGNMLAMAGLMAAIAAPSIAAAQERRTRIELRRGDGLGLTRIVEQAIESALANSAEFELVDSRGNAKIVVWLTEPAHETSAGRVMARIAFDDPERELGKAGTHGKAGIACASTEMKVCADMALERLKTYRRKIERYAR